MIIYIHNSLNANETSFDNQFQEQVWMDLNLKDNDKLLLGVMYRSDIGTSENNDELRKLMQDVSKSKHSHKIVLGGL